MAHAANFTFIQCNNTRFSDPTDSPTTCFRGKINAIGQITCSLICKCSAIVSIFTFGRQNFCTIAFNRVNN